MTDESKKELKRQYRSDVEVVKDVLRDWDPIGVIPELLARGLPPSEYDSYAPHILGMLQRGCGVEEVADHLEFTCEEPMGLGRRTPLSMAHNAKIAADLVAWWKSKQ